MATRSVAFVTGATAGIGSAIAHKLAAAGYALIVSGRRAERLTALADALQTAYGTEVLPLCFDVQDATATMDALAGLPKNWQKIDILVNNAGLSQGLSPVHEGDLGDWDRMLDTNVKGLLVVSRSVSRLMIAAGGGHIIQVSSIAGKEVYSNGNVYCASKHAVEAITKGMRMELNPYGIKVSSIAPGLVETEFSEVRFKGDKERARQVYIGYAPLQAEDIAEAVMFMVDRPAHVNIADLTILPAAQASSTMVRKEL